MAGDGKPYAFDQNSVERIAGVVRRFRVINLEELGREIARNLARGFWVKITDSDTDDDGNWRHQATEVFKAERGQHWQAHPDPRVAIGGEKGIWLYSPDNEHFDNDAIVFVVPLTFLADGIDPDGETDAAAAEEVQEWWTLGGGGSGGEIFRVSSVSTGHALYRGHRTKSPVARAWRPLIVDGVDTQTKYIDGTAFSNGDYAKNLSDHVVYHRDAGAWVSAAGHLTDTDVDDEADLDAQVSAQYLDAGDEVILMDLYGATLGNAEDLVAPIAVGELVLGRYHSTRSDDVQCFSITGRLRFKDGQTDGVGIYAWDDGGGQKLWQRDKEKMT